ncbi:hypothetical protein FRC07_005552 [Ceratobasidium sp. 392]|nr:hypothetical protein FRC07_005552 [Ceratobasidium sp. 392]
MVDAVTDALSGRLTHSETDSAIRSKPRPHKRWFHVNSQGETLEQEAEAINNIESNWFLTLQVADTDDQDVGAEADEGMQLGEEADEEIMDLDPVTATTGKGKEKAVQPDEESASTALQDEIMTENKPAESEDSSTPNRSRPLKRSNVAPKVWNQQPPTLSGVVRRLLARDPRILASELSRNIELPEVSGTRAKSAPSPRTSSESMPINSPKNMLGLSNIPDPKDNPESVVSSTPRPIAQPAFQIGAQGGQNELGQSRRGRLPLEMSIEVPPIPGSSRGGLRAKSMGPKTKPKAPAQVDEESYDLLDLARQNHAAKTAAPLLLGQSGNMGEVAPDANALKRRRNTGSIGSTKSSKPLTKRSKNP